MRALLGLIMRGRVQAITATVLCAALSMIVPPLSYAGGAVVGLATLRQGVREGALVVGGAVALCGVLGLVLAGSVKPGLALLALTLPVWMVATVLATTRSQGMALLASGALGAVAVLAMHAAPGDPVLVWREVLERFFAPAMANADAEVARRVAALLEVWPPVIASVVGAVVAGGVLVSVLLARWAHAMLDNPGGFGREFRTLDVGRVPLGVCLAVVVAGLFGGEPGGLGGNLVSPFAAVLMFQGLAVAHSVARGRKLARGWLVTMYVLLAVMPTPAVAALALAGLLDGWLGLRARAGP